MRTRTETMNEGDRLWPSQIATLVLGILFLGIGIAGFTITGTDGFTDDHTGELLLGFEVNGLHNAVHLALGVLGVVMWWRISTSLAFGLISGIGYGAAFVYGLFAVDESWDVLSLNTADNWLHLGLAVAGFAVAALAVRDRDRLASRRVGRGPAVIDIDEVERTELADRAEPGYGRPVPNQGIRTGGPVEERFRGPGTTP